MSTTAPDSGALRRHLAEVAAGVCERDGLVHDRVDAALARLAGGPSVPPARSVGADGPAVDVLGAAYQAALTRRDRLARGVFYTPLDTARSLVARVIARGEGVSVLDPACGAGAFLVAAAERRGSIGGVTGIDSDPVAVDLARLCLGLCSARLGQGFFDPVDAVVVGDGLTDDPPEGPPDVCVGNPPFAGQLRAVTARSAEDQRRLGEALGDVIDAYTDTAMLFLARAAAVTRPGGRAVMVLPTSARTSRDGRAVRERVAQRWATSEIVEIDPGPLGVTAPLDALVLTPPGAGGDGGGPGVPSVDGAAVEGTVGRLATVRAGFRDGYYGLVPLTREAGDGEPDGVTTAALVTSGLIDPAELAWGRRQARFAKRRWSHPVVELDHLPAPLRADLHTPGRPRLLVASQTRVLEMVADPEGRTVPVTPVVRVIPHTGHDLWRLAAVGASPVAAAHLAREAAGSGRGRSSLRVSAPVVRSLPLPPAGPDWEAAARLVRSAHGERNAEVRRATLVEAARRMTAAHRVPGDEMLEWWRSQLP